VPPSAAGVAGGGITSMAPWCAAAALSASAGAGFLTDEGALRGPLGEQGGGEVERGTRGVGEQSAQYLALPAAPSGVGGTGLLRQRVRVDSATCLAGPVARLDRVRAREKVRSRSRLDVFVSLSRARPRLFRDRERPARDCVQSTRVEAPVIMRLALRGGSKDATRGSDGQRAGERRRGVPSIQASNRSRASVVAGWGAGRSLSLAECHRRVGRVKEYGLGRQRALLMYCDERAGGEGRGDERTWAAALAASRPLPSSRRARSQAPSPVAHSEGIKRASFCTHTTSTSNTTASARNDSTKVRELASAFCHRFFFGARAHASNRPLLRP
jgi:hypothetical protein